MPAQMVTVTVQDNATAYINKIVKELPAKSGNMAWNITQIASSSIKQEANSAFSFPRPYLGTTIRPQKMGEKEYAILAARYALAVERGRKPGKMPPPLGIIEEWARKAGINPYALAKSIATKGTVGRHFIRNGMIKAKPRIDEYVRKEARRLVE